MYLGIYVYVDLYTFYIYTYILWLYSEVPGGEGGGGGPALKQKDNETQ